MKRKIGLFLVTIVTSMLFVGGAKASLSDDIVTARQNSVDLKNYPGVKVDQTIPKEYSTFALGKTPIESATTSGAITVPNDVYEAWQTNEVFTKGTSSLANDSIKGKYSVLYKKANFYNGNYIDVKATVMDFEAVGSSMLKSTPIVILNDTYMGNSNAGLKWVKIKYEFFKSGTNTPVNVKGTTTYWDVDFYQGVILHGNNKGIYTKSNNVLKGTSVSNDPYVFEKNNAPAEDSNSPEMAFSEIFEGTSITRTFTYANPDNQWISDAVWGAGQALYSVPLIYPELPNPTKTVDHSKIELDTEFTYTINQEVPSSSEEYYYKTFAIIDTLEDCLKVDTSKITIKNEEGTDVTNNFTITNNGQTIQMTAKNANTADFYGHVYTVNIKTQIKDNYNIEKWKKGNDYIIPNYATTKYTDYENQAEEQKTEIVNVIYTKPVTPPQQDDVVNVPNTLASIPIYIQILGIILILVAIGLGIYVYKGGKFEFLKKKNN